MKTIILNVDYLGQCGRGTEEKISRKIELLENQTLDDLHEAIIYQSFGWDDPHLYSFHLDNVPYSKDRSKEYTCDDHMNIDPEFGKTNSTTIELKNLKFTKNQIFLFVFDFGDDHHFRIKVKGFGEIQKGQKYPIILEEVGKAPEQYPPLEE